MSRPSSKPTRTATPAWPGQHFPLGATWAAESTNFAVHAADATAVWVCLFDEAGRETAHQLTEHTLGVWHGAVPAVAPGQRYGYRADGPWEPDAGMRFNPAKLLLDPYARAVSGHWRHHSALYAYRLPRPHDSAATAGRRRRTRDNRDSARYAATSVVVGRGEQPAGWEQDTPPRTPWTDTVLYELHVKGFTARHPGVPESVRGTYAGLATPAVTDYLTDLGVTAVELLPVQQLCTEAEVAARGQVNYWGYNTVGFFAPHADYCSSGDRGGQVAEFRAMVAALHAAGIEVILDVVYNHTAEGGPLGPSLSFRGLDDAGYYHHVDPATYFDTTGCGNTVDCSRSPGLRLVLDSLRYWATEMHVDGFRFDLATALARSAAGVDMAGPFLTCVAQDPVLRHVKLIAEPWDLGPDGYQVGRFPPPWCEWNDHYRDTVRDFWRGEPGRVDDLASRLAGSSDLYADDGRSPYASVNFVTAHDGFTLRDLVSYQRKHNDANGEGNADGTDDNRSANHGVEGETDDPDVVALRQRQAANLMATLCLSTGVPMLAAGDERGRTQGGNNNAYVQDNEISWVDWDEKSAWTGLHRLTRAALALRRDHPALRQRHFFSGTPPVEGGPKDLVWIHPEGREMAHEDWQDDGLATLGMFLSGNPLRAPGPRGEPQYDCSFLVWLNAADGPVKVVLPHNQWVQAGEVVLATADPQATGERYAAGDVVNLPPRSLVLLREV